MRGAFASLAVSAIIAQSVVTVAAGESGYATKPTYNVALPVATSSFTTSTDAFGADATGDIDGFPLRSKLVAATNDSIFLQKNFGASRWLTVGKVVDFYMDPAFIKISPDGSKIALGTGFYKPLYVFPAAALSALAPPNVGAVPGSRTYDVTFYDAAWRDSRFLVLNGAAAGGSSVTAVDTEAPEGSNPFRTIIDAIPGASGGVTFDHQGNLITGNGYTYSSDVSATGQLKIWSAAEIATAFQPMPAPVDYLGSGHVLAHNVLSAASLGVDSNGNLHVGGSEPSA